MPSAPDIGDMTFTTGDRVEVQLPMGSGGNGALKYDLEGEDCRGTGTEPSNRDVASSCMAQRPRL